MGSTTIIGIWVTAFKQMLHQPSMVAQAYEKARGKPFTLPTLTNYHHLVSSPHHLKELSNAKDDHLTMNGFFNDTFFPKYTLHGFSYDPADPHNRASVQTMRGKVRASLPSLHERLESAFRGAFLEQLEQKPKHDGWAALPVYSMSFHIASAMYTVNILGPELASIPEIAKAARQYAKDAAISTQVLALLPTSWHPVVGNVLMGWSGAMKKLYGKIEGVVKERLQQKLDVAEPETKPLDCIQFIMDIWKGPEEHRIERVTQLVLGLIFASAHQVPMLISFVLMSLCKHPEYVQVLRDEVENSPREALFGTAKTDTPLLDSFIKETARTNTLQAVTVNRKVERDFTFSDGFTMPGGTWVGIPQQALMLDPRNYDDPLRFDGRRFVTTDNGAPVSATRLSHPSESFPFWGSVARACPGRFYVSSVVKMVIAHIVMNYDVKLADEKTARTAVWLTNTMPHPSLKIMVRERQA